MAEPRARLSTKARVELFARHNGVCHLCSGRIQAGEGWEVSHPNPLAAGGSDDDSNRAPAHAKCHRAHTARVDAPLIAKVRRQHAAHIGARLRGRGFRKRPRPLRRSPDEIARMER